MAQRMPSINDPGGTRDAGDVAGMPSPPAGEAPCGTEPRTTTPAATVHRAPTPFVWQHGRCLLLLDDDHLGWVMAELRFDVERCRYVEVRRASYRWLREAVGAVLSRALASGHDAADDSALSLRLWLSRYYGIVLYPDPAPSPQIDTPELPS